MNDALVTGIATFLSQMPAHDAQAGVASVAALRDDIARLAPDELRAVLREVVLALGIDAVALSGALERAMRLDPIGNEAQPERSIALGLAAELLLVHPPLRLALAEARKSHAVMSAIEQALASLELAPSEIVALVAVPSERLRNHWLDGWSANHADAARDLVERWLVFDETTRRLGAEAIRPMIVAAVRAEHDRTWHDHVIEALERHSSEESWRLSVQLAACGWPQPEPGVADRHAAVLRRVARLPARLADAGLDAVRRDWMAHPEAVAATTLRIVDMLDRQPIDAQYLQIVLSLAVDNLRAALDQTLKAGGVFDQADRMIELLVELDPRAPGGSVDHFLATLLKLDVTKTRHAVESWLSRHAVVLWQKDAGFRDLFPFFAHCIDEKTRSEWLLDWLHASDAGVRMLAAKFLSLDEDVPFQREQLQWMSAGAVLASAHQLVATATRGEALVPRFWALVDARPDLSEPLGKLFLNDVLDDYPSTCRSTLNSRRAQLDREIEPRIEALEAQLASSLIERDTAIELRAAMPELRVTSGGRFEAWRMHNHAGQKEMRLARSRSVFAQFTTHFVVIEGEALESFGAQAAPMRFRRYSFSADLPRRINWDPLGNQMRRVSHLKRAAELLAADGLDS